MSEFTINLFNPNETRILSFETLKIIETENIIEKTLNRSSLNDITQIDIVIDLIKKVEDNYWQYNALKRITVVLAIHGYFDAAIYITGFINDNNSKFIVLREIAIILARTKEFERAIRAVNCIPVKNYKIYALKEILKHLKIHGDKEKAILVEHVIECGIRCIELTEPDYFNICIEPIQTKFNLAVELMTEEATPLDILEPIQTKFNLAIELMTEEETPLDISEPIQTKFNLAIELPSSCHFPLRERV